MGQIGKKNPKPKNRKRSLGRYFPPDIASSPVQPRQAFMQALGYYAPQVIYSLFNSAWPSFLEMGQFSFYEKSGPGQLPNLSEYVVVSGWPKDELGTDIDKRDFKFSHQGKVVEHNQWYQDMLHTKTRLKLYLIAWGIEWNLSTQWCTEFAQKVLLTHWKKNLPGRKKAISSSQRFADILSGIDLKKEHSAQLYSWQATTISMPESHRAQSLNPALTRGLQKKLREALSTALSGDHLEQCLRDIQSDIKKHCTAQRAELRNDDWEQSAFLWPDQILYTIYRRLPPLIPWEELAKIELQTHPERYEGRSLGTTAKRKEAIERIRREVDIALNVLELSKEPSFATRGRPRTVNNSIQ